MTSLTNLQAFNELMVEYDVPVDNNITVGPTGYLDKPVPDRLFCGVDNHGRAFVNIPIDITPSPELEKNLCWDRKYSSFIVFQRYSTNPTVFVLGRPPVLVTRESFLGDKCDDFFRLRELLAGETVRFRGPHLISYKIDPVIYIDVRLIK